MINHNYYKIINKYINPKSGTYPFFMIHSILVTKKALKIGRKLKLSADQMQFIEEASMLHDIGIIKIDDDEMDCFGELPYICHGIEGAKILRAEGLEKHARVAELHTGVGIYKDDIKKNNLPLPEKDFIPETLEEEIISYADLFFSKAPDYLWYEKDLDEVKKSIMKFGELHIAKLEEWIEKFK